MHKPRFSARWYAAVLLLITNAATMAADSPANREIPFRTVGYLPDYRVDQIGPAVGRRLTDVIFFSVVPEQSGKFRSKALGSDKTATLLKQLRDQQVNINLCVGGWDRSKGFAEISATEVSRQQFAQGLTSYCQEHGFSGADIDWEHPKNDVEATNYGLLLSEIAGAFKPHGLRLTAAIAAWQTLSAKAIESVDAIHLMSYDAEGKHSTLEQARADVRKLLAAGVPANKIILGLPFYGRGISQRNQVKTYAEIAASDAKSLDNDEINGLYFNGPSTIRAKIRFAREQMLGGVMIWEIGQDAPGENALLKVISDEAATGG